MPSRVEALEARQQSIVARSDALRARLSAEGAELRPSLVIADRLRLGLGWVQSNQPLLIAAVVGISALLVMRRPRAAVGLAGTLYSAWNLAKRSLPWLQLARSVYTATPARPRPIATGAVPTTSAPTPQPRPGGTA